MEKNLINCFNDALCKQFSCKKQMAYTVAEILDIEIESAYRRISGKVNFTVKEVGILSKEMNLSLDSMLFGNSDKTPILFRINSEPVFSTTNMMCEFLEETLAHYQSLKTGNVKMGQIFDALPVEIFINFPYLMKFVYFKWGHYNINTKEYETYGSWNIPERMIEVNRKLMECIDGFSSRLYIWDNALLWNLINEINYHMEIETITSEEAGLIREEFAQMLERLEKILKHKTRGKTEYEFYVTNFNIALTGYYVLSGNKYISGIRTHFLESHIHHDYETGYKLHQWINYIKKFSSLISGSGEKQRVLFFKDQYRHLERIKCEV